MAPSSRCRNGILLLVIIIICIGSFGCTYLLAAFGNSEFIVTNNDVYSHSEACNSSVSSVTQTYTSVQTITKTKKHKINVWMLWFQGWNNSANISSTASVRGLQLRLQLRSACVKSWKYYNSAQSYNFTLKFHFVDQYNLHQYLRPYVDIRVMKLYLNKKQITYQALSDIIRLVLLKHHGGLWIDTTVFCNQPLQEWLTHFMTNYHFFAFSTPTKKEMISSWFLYADKSSYIINKWYNAMFHLWFCNNSSNNYTIPFHQISALVLRDYFWVHHLFNKLYEKDNKFRTIWNNTKPHISSEFNPHLVGPHFIAGRAHKKLTKAIKEHIDQKLAPVYKLSKYPQPNRNETYTAYHYLLDSIK